jgi:hypothetical protein
VLARVIMDFHPRTEFAPPDCTTIPYEIVTHFRCVRCPISLAVIKILETSLLATMSSLLISNFDQRPEYKNLGYAYTLKLSFRSICPGTTSLREGKLRVGFGD